MQGVAGARITSTDRNSSSTLARYQRRNFCARSTSTAGTIAPAMRRSRTAGAGRRRHERAGDEAVAHGGIEILRPLAQAVEMERSGLGGGDDVSRRAGARRFGQNDGLGRAERLRHARDSLLRLGENVLLE